MLRVEDVAKKGPARQNLNLRLAREIWFSQQQRFRLSAEILNVTNNALPDTVTLSMGHQYGRITAISTPRIARLVVTDSF